MKDKEYVHIRVSREIVEKLKETGKKSETYDDLISRLVQSDEIVLKQLFEGQQEKGVTWAKVSLVFEYDQNEPMHIGGHVLRVEGDEQPAMIALKALTFRLTKEL